MVQHSTPPQSATQHARLSFFREQVAGGVGGDAGA